MICSAGVVRRSLFVLAVVAVPAIWSAASAAAWAGKVSLWKQASQEDFAKGTMEGTAVSSQGMILLARDLEPVADLEAGSAWDLTVVGQNKIWAVTAEPAQLVEVIGNKKMRVVWKRDDVAAFALCRLPDGSALVGTGPAGQIFRVTPDGKESEFFTVQGNYVWDLACDAGGTVYAATGPKGKIYRIDKQGQGEVYFDTKQPHVLCLALGADGSLLAGTDGNGLIWSVTAPGEGRVLYDVEEGEVRTLWADSDGNVFAGTAGGNKSRPAGRSSSSSTSKGSKNAIYRIDRRGGIRKIFELDGLIHSIRPLHKTAGRLVVGTGSKGELYSVDAAGGDTVQMARLDVEELLAIEAAPDGLFVATGNPGKIFRVSSGYRKQGVYLSAPLDAKMQAQFGSIVWQCDRRMKTSVEVRLRSGNTSKPDETWSAWSKPLTDPLRSTATCPPARFLQYQLVLSTADPAISPQVRSVLVRYRTANQPPEISALEIPHVEEGEGKEPQQKLKFTWEAKDPNEDEMEYQLSFRKLKWKQWIKLKSGLSDANFEWDITRVPEGVYLLRLEASDRPSNPAQTAHTAVRISEPFTVDSKPPRLSAKLDKVTAAQTTVTVEAKDALSPIVKASYSVDSGDWVSVFPTDGLFDSFEEKIRFSVEGLEPGSHVIVIRATDAAGYTASIDQLFKVPEK